MKIRFTFLIFGLVFLTACQKEEPIAPDFSNKITITTGEAVDIDYISATISGSLGETYNQNISDYGHCWDTVDTPTTDIANRKTSFGATNEAKSYTSNLENLEANKQYYVWAYFIIDGTTVFSEPISVTTQLGYPTISISSISEIGTTTAISGGTLIDDGGVEVTAMGICWSTSGDPTIADNKTSEIVDLGNFESNLFGLIAETKYYVRAYASYFGGTVYGALDSLTTKTNNSLTDIDGNVYNWVQIGDQVWMAENLRVTNYADGTPIPLVEDNTTWDALGDNNTDKAYCWYDNDVSHKETYGALYTWSAAMNGVDSSSTNPSGVQGACPTGWHLPSDTEWTELYLFIRDDLVGHESTGGPLKTISGWKDNGNGTDEYGFGGKPAGVRDGSGGFWYLGEKTYWWSSSISRFSAGENVYNHHLSYSSQGLDAGIGDKDYGYSIRCVKD